MHFLFSCSFLSVVHGNTASITEFHFAFKWVFSIIISTIFLYIIIQTKINVTLCVWLFVLTILSSSMPLVLLKFCFHSFWFRKQLVVCNIWSFHTSFVFFLAYNTIVLHVTSVYRCQDCSDVIILLVLLFSSFTATAEPVRVLERRLLTQSRGLSVTKHE